MIRTFPRDTPAKSMRRVRRAWKQPDGTFKVYGRKGTEYLIPVRGGLPECPCEARTACWHGDLVVARLERERFSGRPATRPEPTAAELFAMLGVAS